MGKTNIKSLNSILKSTGTKITANVIADRVEASIADSLHIENQLSSAGRLDTSYNTYTGTQELVAEVRDYVASGKKLNKYLTQKIDVLAERAKTDFWSGGIKMGYNESKRRGNNHVAEYKQISVKEIEKLKQKYDENPASVNQKEYRIISRYYSSINAVANARAMSASPQELADLRKAKMNRMEARDVSFGGSSTLINDLAFSAGIEKVGRDFVETLQSAMQDPAVYEAIESWYRSDKGTKARYALDNATGSNWYENYNEARNAIIAVINMIRKNIKLSEEADAKLGELTADADNEDDYEWN